ncbi:MAG: SLC13 family permease [Treponema sp.]|nr:citrate transporter [Treponema sp.]MCI5665923.1 citrate transporter [Spirochaetia bacterium]MDD7769014.1 SLC13 family permease [Treponema sp.]MDY3130924.1 SLC13 family permease [Treponema sp.]
MLVAKILAVTIFVVMFIMIILEIFERHHITLVCGLLTLLLVFGLGMHSFDAALETLNVRNIFTSGFWYSAGESHESSSGVNWATIIFILGMMIMVEGMARVGFFRWLCMRLAKLVHYKVLPIFVTFMIMSGVLAMFIDSITVILFLSTVTIELSQLLKFNPLPMILSEIFCANLGGSATMCGDPPNIIIGTSFGYSFADFIMNTGAIAGICMIFTVLFFFFAYKKDLKGDESIDVSTFPTPESAITDKKGFILSSFIFGCAVILLVTHAMTGLTVATIGVFISILTLLSAPKHIPEIIKKVDYKTILFFLGLFIVVGGLEQTGILEIVAGFIGKISGGNVYLMIAIIIWVSAIASAFIDNIPFAATMIPVIQSLAATTGVSLTTMTWALSMGTDIGGSATPIGASANVVGTSVAGKAGYPVGWGTYCAKAVPATIIVMIISTVFIFVRYL